MNMSPGESSRSVTKARPVVEMSITRTMISVSRGIEWP